MKTFEWLDYLKLAIDFKEHIKEDDPMAEALYRTSISRSYYFVFHYSQDYLQLLGITFKKTPNVHKEVCKVLEDLSKKENNYKISKDLKEISVDLERLRTLRNKADYDEYMKNIRKETETSLIISKNIKEIVEKLKTFK